MRDLVFLVLVIAGGQGIFLSIYLSLKKNKRTSGLLLGLMFFSFSLQLFDLVLIYSEKALTYPHLAFWSTPFNLALGPLLYLYTRNIKYDISPWKRLNWLHFMPFLLHIVFIIGAFHIQSTSFKIAFIENMLSIQQGTNLNELGASNLIFTILVYAQLGVYLWLSFSLIYRNNDAQLETRRWLKILWKALVVVTLFGLLQFVLLASNINQQPITGYLGALLGVIYIYYGALIIMKKPSIIFNPPKIKKYQYSQLTDTEAVAILDKLKAYMHSHKPYKNSQLTLKELAIASELSNRNISQVINERLQKNFHDFLNEYRVNEFKKEVFNTKNAHLSILGIAMECGFNSKSTFNTVFKKSEGMTPSQFKKKHA